MRGSMVHRNLFSLPAGVLRRAFDASSEGLLVVSDPDGDVLDVNEAFLRLLGRPREEVLAATAEELGLWREPLAGSITSEPISDADGDVLLIRTVPNDREALLGELRAAERGFKSLVEQIPAISYTEVDDPTSPTGTRTVYISPQAGRLLGYTSEELLDDDLWNAITHPEDFPDVLAEEARVDRSGEPFLMEYRILAKDGSVHWFRDESALLHDPETGQKMWQGVMLDITEHKASAAALEETQRRYQSLVETIPAVVFVDRVDERSTNIYTSPQSEAILGFTPQEWASDPDLWRNMLHPDDRDRVLALLPTFEQRSAVWDEEYRVIAKDGRMVWVRDVARKIESVGGEVHAQGFLLDITGQKVAEKALKEALGREHFAAEQLRALDRLKNTLLHALSHDLKGPITAILGSASTLSNADLRLGSEERSYFLRGITERALRMDRLITDVLDLERLDRGLIDPDRSPTDLVALARSVANACEGLEGRAWTVAGSNVTVAIDAAKVERIIDNLLVNAARHTPNGSPVEVKILAREAGAQIIVDDRGPGVPDEIKETIFEAFRQGSAGGNLMGMGIGLSLVSRFAELHGGRAWVEDRVGGGASFRVFLAG